MITFSVIWAEAEDLRQSKSLSDSFTNMFRNAFAGITPRVCEDDDDDEPETKYVTTEATILPDSNELKTMCISKE